MDEETPKFAVSNKVYDGLRFLAVILLPAIGAAYFSLADVWGLPKAAEVVGTITIVDTFLGVIVAALRRSYNASPAKYDGEVVITETPEQTSNMNFRVKPKPLVVRDEVLLRVKRQ